MPGLLVLYGRCKSVAFLRMDMHNGRLVRALHTAEYPDKLLHIVAFFQIVIVEAPGLEPIVAASAVAFSQGTQVLVDASVVFGDRHFVVVHHDDDARSQFGSFVQTFESLSSRERTVADNGNDILVRTLYVTCLLQTRGEAYGGGCVSDLKVVVLRTFGG